MHLSTVDNWALPVVVTRTWNGLPQHLLYQFSDKSEDPLLTDLPMTVKCCDFDTFMAHSSQPYSLHCTSYARSYQVYKSQ